MLNLEGQVVLLQLAVHDGANDLLKVVGDVLQVSAVELLHGYFALELGLASLLLLPELDLVSPQHFHLVLDDLLDLGVPQVLVELTCHHDLIVVVVALKVEPVDLLDVVLHQLLGRKVHVVLIIHVLRSSMVATVDVVGDRLGVGVVVDHVDLSLLPREDVLEVVLGDCHF